MTQLFCICFTSSISFSSEGELGVVSVYALN